MRIFNIDVEALYQKDKKNQHGLTILAFFSIVSSAQPIWENPMLDLLLQAATWVMHHPWKTLSLLYAALFLFALTPAAPIIDAVRKLQRFIGWKKDTADGSNLRSGLGGSRRSLRRRKVHGTAATDSRKSPDSDAV